MTTQTVEIIDLETISPPTTTIPIDLSNMTMEEINKLVFGSDSDDDDSDSSELKLAAPLKKIKLEPEYAVGEKNQHEQQKVMKCWQDADENEDAAREKEQARFLKRAEAAADVDDDNDQDQDELMTEKCAKREEQEESKRRKLSSFKTMCDEGAELFERLNSVCEEANDIRKEASRWFRKLAKMIPPRKTIKKKKHHSRPRKMIAKSDSDSDSD